MLAGYVTTGNWERGKGTHYGPYPQYPAFSEAGYQPNDVGVACSDGSPGGDPRWNTILKQGTKSNPLMNSTVWPLTATVAVSESSWGKNNKNKICFQKIAIRNLNNHSMQLTAHIVDFCPATGCNWPSQERPFNVDIYGQDSWNALGGGLLDGSIDLEIKWPPGLTPNGACSLGVFFTFMALIVV